MKRLLLIYVLSILSITLMAQEETISATATTTVSGTAWDIEICLANPSTRFISFQFDVELPNGLTLQSITNTPSADRLSGYTVESVQLANNNVRVAAYNQSSSSMISTSQTATRLLTLHITSSSIVSTGSFTIKNNLFTKDNFQEIILPPATAPINHETPDPEHVDYTITFDTDGGNTIAPITQPGNTPVTAPSVPTKTGYTFVGWDKQIPSIMPTENITIKALWTINNYTITYMLDGKQYKQVRVQYNSDITPEEAPTKTGYTFSGWSAIPSVMPARDVEVTGTFTVNKYTLTYKVDGKVYKSIKVEYGAIITPEPAPEKKDYEFNGWKEQIPTTMPAHDVEITGEFVAYTGIESTQSTPIQKLIYNIQGQRIKSKGINIIDGCKILSQ